MMGETQLFQLAAAVVGGGTLGTVVTAIINGRVQRRATSVELGKVVDAKIKTLLEAYDRRLMENDERLHAAEEALRATGELLAECERDRSWLTTVVQQLTVQLQHVTGRAYEIPPRPEDVASC